MASSDLYDSYTKNDSYMADYVRYQERYAKSIRESDRRLIQLLGEHLGAEQEGRVLLDIGCSSGNLLLHIRHAHPSLSLVGGELSEVELAACRANPDLAGMSFEIMDIRSLGEEPRFDVITANAILYGFGEAFFAESLVSMAKAIKPGGALIVFDFFHPFEQDLDIVERSNTFPEGHPLHFRSYRTAERLLNEAGFTKNRFLPFEIPVDLAKQGHHSVQTWTDKTEDGARLMFRGTLFQPWCHLVAVKPG